MNWYVMDYRHTYNNSFRKIQHPFQHTQINIYCIEQFKNKIKNTLILLRLISSEISFTSFFIRISFHVGANTKLVPILVDIASNKISICIWRHRHHILSRVYLPVCEARLYQGASKICRFDGRVEKANIGAISQHDECVYQHARGYT